MDDFSKAMTEEEINDIRANGAPCVVCGVGCYNAGVWMPSREILDLMKVPAEMERAIVYAICSQCVMKRDWLRSVERSILKSLGA